MFFGLKNPPQLFNKLLLFLYDKKSSGPHSTILILFLKRSKFKIRQIPILNIENAFDRDNFPAKTQVLMITSNQIFCFKYFFLKVYVLLKNQMVFASFGLVKIDSVVCFVRLCLQKPRF